MPCLVANVTGQRAIPWGKLSANDMESPPNGRFGSPFDNVTMDVAATGSLDQAGTEN
jgi:hypothetical protein